MEREQFTFYASFAKAARRIKKPAERCAFYDAVIDFALFGNAPDLESVPENVGLAMELVMPVLTSSRNKAANRMNKTKSNENKTEQTENKTEGGEIEKKKEKENEKENKREREKEKENECSISPPTPSEFFSGDLLSAVEDWLSYKRERREAYKPTGLKTLFSQLRKAADQHGEAAVVDVIRNSIASNYAGITLDRLSSPAYKPATGNRVVASGWDSENAQEAQKKDLERLGKFLNGKI